MSPKPRKTPDKGSKKSGKLTDIEVSKEHVRRISDEESESETQEPEEVEETELDADSAIEEEASSLPATRLPKLSDEAEEEDVEIEAGSRALSATDPLKRYLEEVRRYPLLTAEQELALALKLRNEGDMEAAKILVSANLRLVVKIAFEYRSLYTNVMDLIQEGNVGLMKAVSKYDPSKGARLGYYASWWIKSYMLKYLLDNFRLVKIGTTQAQKKLFYHLMREKERLEAQGIPASPKLLADQLHVREKDVVEMEGRLSGGGAEVSLDAPVGDGEGRSASHVDFLADDEESADEKLARNELVKLLKKKLPDFEKTLNEREQRLLHDRLLSDEPQTLQEVADNYGLTRERARQIEAKVVFKLKDFLGL